MQLSLWFTLELVVVDLSVRMHQQRRRTTPGRHMAAFPQVGGAIAWVLLQQGQEPAELKWDKQGITFPVVSNAMLRAIALLGESSLAEPLSRVWYPRPSCAWVVVHSDQW